MAEPNAKSSTESPADRLDRAFRAVLNVSNADLLEEEARLKAIRDKQHEAKRKDS